MTKEMKRPTSHISGNSIKPALSKAVEFYTDNNIQAYECIRERDDYIDYLERKLNNASQQQALPVVPECVAELIKHAKDNNKTIRWCLYGNCKELYPQAAEWIGADDDIEFTDKTWKQQELFVRAWLDGYTVEKPQLFYLKNKLTGAYLYYDEATKLYSDIVGNVEDFFGTKTKFTEAEIGSMETGSYEQIKVEGD